MQDNIFVNYSTAWRAMLEVNYKLNNRYAVFCRGTYTHFIYSIYKKEDAFKLQPFGYDISIGIRLML